MKQVYPHIDLAMAMSLLAAGAVIQDSLIYANTPDQDDMLGAPVYINRAVAGIVGPEVLDFLAERMENDDPENPNPDLIRKKLLLIPNMPFHTYWIGNDNELNLFEVKVKYVDTRVRHVVPIFSIDEEVERNFNGDEPVNVDERGNLDSGYQLLYDALKLEELVTSSLVDEEEEEEEENDDDEVEDSEEEDDEGQDLDGIDEDEEERNPSVADADEDEE